MAAMELSLKLAAEDQHLVWAEVYAPNFPDADGDIMTEEAIQKMAYKYMKERKTDQIDLQHNNKLIPGAYMVESFIARKGDDTFIPGAWVVGMYVPDPVWGSIKKGDINGFSMEALVTRRPDIMEIEIPSVIKGMVSKADDGHEHEFFVSYDDQGQFLGGTTSTVDGHSHVIKRGTITETANNHNHRFSYVEKLLP